MKVLFAVNNEKISEAIIKKYQIMYKEIISWKNVYFFNAIIKELQKDKSYDRIIIGEDLEPFSNNNYEVIDNFLFDKLDSISDEASNTKEGDIPIILIATDRREKENPLLAKLFGIGIYSVLLGQDRRIENVCKLIKQPRTKKEAKIYYKIEVDDIEYQTIDPDSVSETEIENIKKHYKNLGKNEEKYVESFNHISEQYTDTQLKLIIKYLPLNIRAVLEEKSPRYQQLMIGSVKGKIKKDSERFTTKNMQSSSQNRIGLIDKELEKSKLTKPVVIPSTINVQNVKKAYNKDELEKNDLEDSRIKNTDINDLDLLEDNEVLNFENENEVDITANEITTKKRESTNEKIEVEEASIKRGRGRPRKKQNEQVEEAEVKIVKRGRGRPKKVDKVIEEETKCKIEKKPEKVENINKEVNDAKIEKNSENEIKKSNFEDSFLGDFNNDISLPGVENEFLVPGVEKEIFLPMVDEIVEENNFNIPNDFNKQDDNVNIYNDTYKERLEEKTNINKISSNNFREKHLENNQNIYNNNIHNVEIEPIKMTKTSSNLSNLIIGDKKLVAFVGTSKNGTSFLVNNLAVNLSNRGINTAILDLTKNKNAYYIYTANEDRLREQSFRCIEGLRRGVPEGIKVNKNLTVYTTVPGDESTFDDYNNILETLVRNYSLVLMDCDFDTNLNYFANSQEIYLVQTYDILTIQPLTEFLNELKYKNILDQNRLRIVINKTLKLRKLTDKMIIGGISCYNDPASTYINTLFDKDTIRYTTIPFESETYARYLERMVDCEISLSGYSKIFLDALNKLSDMVYPLIVGNNKYQPNKNYNDYSKKNTTTFNTNMNETLNKMRNSF